MLHLVSCVCLLISVATAQYQPQYSGAPNQPQYQPQYSGAPSQPQYQGAPDIGQPITSTNYNTGDGQVRSESVDNEGNVKGQYSYVDPNGKTITVKYTAGKNGFQVEGDHLPQAPAPAPAQPQYNPAPQQYNPAPQQYNPASQQYNPASPQYNPAPQQYNPAPQQYNPAPQQYNPAPQQYNPAPQQYNPAPQQPLFRAAASPYQQSSQFSPLNIPQNLQTQGSPSPNIYSQQPVAFPQSPAGVSPQQSGAPQHRFGAGSVSVNNQPGQGYSYSFNLA